MQAHAYFPPLVAPQPNVPPQQTQIAPDGQYTPKVGDVWFRFKDVRYASTLDEFERSNGDGRLQVELAHYVVVSVAPKSVLVARYYPASDGPNTQAFAARWVTPQKEHFWGPPHRVLLGARKRLAHPTQALAMQSFIERKKAQERILARQLRAAQTALGAACLVDDPAAREIAEKACAARRTGSGHDFN